MIKARLKTRGDLDVLYALNYDWIRGDMKYSFVVSCGDGMPLKRHWFDKPNKRWWGLIINGGIDDSAWWPWAPSDWMGSLWIMNEEIPDWSLSLSLFQTLSWHFNGASSSGDDTPTNISTPAVLKEFWLRHCFAIRLRRRCEPLQSAHDRGNIFFFFEYVKLESNLKWYGTKQTCSSSRTGGTTLKCHWWVCPWLHTVWTVFLVP